MSGRISRRAFIGGAAGATVIAGGGVSWAAFLAREDGGSTPGAPVPPAEPTQAPAPTPTLPPPPPGGRQVISAPGSIHIDTFDAQLAGNSSVVEVLGRTHSRLIQWEDSTPRGLVPDLASAWEQPDATTFVFTVDPKAKWHDRQPINGRPVTAEDVVLHFRRSLELAASGKAPLAQRYHAYSGLQSVESPEAGKVRFRLNTPDPYFLDLLASEFALVQAPETVRDFASVWSKADSDHVIGSGPWTFDWTDGGARFTAWRRGHREAQLDELFVLEPRDVAKRFAAGDLDEAFTSDRRDAAKLQSAPRGVPGLNRFQREIVMSSFFIGAPPWNNPELVTAISYALGRLELAKQLFGGRAEVVRTVPPVLYGSHASMTLEGWGGANGGPNGDTFTEARRKWIAAGGPGLGSITIDFPSVFDPLYSASSVVIDQLNSVLGPQFRPAVETYTTISKRVLEGYYGKGRAAFWFGWGPPIHTARPEAYYADLYAPGSPGQLAVGGPGRAGGVSGANEISDSGHLGIVPWVHQYSEVFRSPGHVGPAPSPFWQQHLDYQRRNT